MNCNNGHLMLTHADLLGEILKSLFYLLYYQSKNFFLFYFCLFSVYVSFYQSLSSFDIYHHSTKNTSKNKVSVFFLEHIYPDQKYPTIQMTTWVRTLQYTHLCHVSSPASSGVHTTHTVLSRIRNLISEFLTIFVRDVAVMYSVFYSERIKIKLSNFRTKKFFFSQRIVQILYLDYIWQYINVNGNSLTLVVYLLFFSCV